MRGAVEGQVLHRLDGLKARGKQLVSRCEALMARRNAFVDGTH